MTVVDTQTTAPASARERMVGRTALLEDGSSARIDSATVDTLTLGEPAYRTVPLDGAQVQAIFPAPGELVHPSVMDAVGAEGYWLGYEPSRTGGLGACVLLGKDGQVARHQVPSVAAVDARSVVVAEDTAAEATAAACAAVLSLNTLITAERRERLEFVDRLVEVAHREADERDWCSDFDDILQDLGLPRRQHEYRVRVRFSGYVDIERTAESFDDAAENIGSEDVLDNLNSYDITIDDTEEN